MDPNRPRRRRKPRSVEHTHPNTSAKQQEEPQHAALPIPVESSAESSATEEVALSEIPVTSGTTKRTRIRHWSAEYSKRNRLLKQNIPIPVAKKLTCSVCKKKLSNNNGLKRHMRIHTGEKPFKCNSCPDSFDRADKLRNHEQLHLQESLRCKHCKDEFQSLNLLRIHIARVHARTGPENLHKREYICGYCGCKFSSAGNLSRHKLIHMNKKPFQCEICKAGFTRKYIFEAHLTAHAKGTLLRIPYKFYKCKICGIRFNRSFNVIQHMRKVHPTEDIGPNLSKRMEQVFDYWERRALARKAKEARDAALGRILQPRLLPKPLKRRLLQ